MYAGADGKVRAADVEYKVPGESKFRVTTRPIHNLVLVVPVEEQTMEETEEQGDQEYDDADEEVWEGREEHGGKGPGEADPPALGDPAEDPEQLKEPHEGSSEDKEVMQGRKEHEGGEPQGPDLPVPRNPAEEEGPKGPGDPNQSITQPRGNLKVAYQDTGKA